jgi:hypothetical protein
MKIRIQFAGSSINSECLPLTIPESSRSYLWTTFSFLKPWRILDKKSSADWERRRKWRCLSIDLDFWVFRSYICSNQMLRPTTFSLFHYKRSGCHHLLDCRSVFSFSRASQHQFPQPARVLFDFQKFRHSLDKVWMGRVQWSVQDLQRSTILDYKWKGDRKGLWKTSFRGRSQEEYQSLNQKSPRLVINWSIV